MPDHLTVSCRFDLDGILEESVEQQATMIGPAAVEAKCVFIKVVSEMLVAHGALVGPAKPAFQERHGQETLAWRDPTRQRFKSDTAKCAIFSS